MAENPLVEKFSKLVHGRVTSWPVVVHADEMAELLKLATESREQLEEAERIIAGMVYFAPAPYVTVKPFQTSHTRGAKWLQKMRNKMTPAEIRKFIEGWEHE